MTGPIATIWINDRRIKNGRSDGIRINEVPVLFGGEEIAARMGWRKIELYWSLESQVDAAIRSFERQIGGATA